MEQLKFERTTHALTYRGARHHVYVSHQGVRGTWYLLVPDSADDAEAVLSLVDDRFDAFPDRDPAKGGLYGTEA